MPADTRPSPRTVPGPAGRPPRRGPGRFLRPGPGLRRAAVLAAVAVFGGWLGLVVAGTSPARVGPVETRMSLHPDLHGGSRVDIAPLGSLELDTHRAPLRLDVDVRRLNPDAARAIAKDPARLANLQDEVASGVEHGMLELGLRAAAAVAAGSCAVGLVVYRRPRRALAAAGASLGLLAASLGGAALSWNPKSVLEPHFTGLLTGAPQVVGNARSIVADFGVYRQELARLVGNVTKLYDAATTLPAYNPDPGTVRVLHVSDIHLNPAAWDLIRSVVAEYRIDAVVDTGDLMDHGSAAEDAFADGIPGLGAPYVYVRGNHDSAGSQAAVARQRHAVVLDEGRTATVAGLRIAGWGDPQFTPDRSVQVGGEPAEEAMGKAFAARIAGMRTPPDIAAVHEPTAAQQLDGRVPLVLAGHTHVRDTRMLEHGTRIFVQGSTGGSGLRALESNPPTPVSLSVLYFDRVTHRLQAWDDITLGGLGRTTAQIDRHLADESSSPAPGGPSASPAGPPSPGPSGTPAGSPAGGSPASPAGAPSGTPAGASPGATPGRPPGPATGSATGSPQDPAPSASP
ncbi:metallophosphoesterase [Streptomyces sp. NPDC001380]|uniref:metallophosphoesterase family protein n=1 Tax=Streptomyces sp. NPDC001380 TaxID=3364566 RepID=UPI0036CE2364